MSSASRWLNSVCSRVPCSIPLRSSATRAARLAERLRVSSRNKTRRLGAASPLDCSRIMRSHARRSNRCGRFSLFSSWSLWCRYCRYCHHRPCSWTSPCWATRRVSRRQLGHQIGKQSSRDPVRTHLVLAARNRLPQGIDFLLRGLRQPRQLGYQRLHLQMKAGKLRLIFPERARTSPCRCGRTGQWLVARTFAVRRLLCLLICIDSHIRSLRQTLLQFTYRQKLRKL